MSTTIPPSINPMAAVGSPPPLLSPQRPTLRSTSAIARDRYSAVAGRAAEEAEKLAQQQAAQSAKQVSLPSRSERDFDDRNERSTDRAAERRQRDNRSQADNRRNGIPSDLPSDRQSDRSSNDRMSNRQSDRQTDRDRQQRLPNSSNSSAGPAPRNDRWGRDERDRIDRNDRSNDRNDRNDRNNDRNDRNDRGNDRNDRSDRNDRNDRNDRSDRNDRNDRNDRDRNDRNDRDGRDNKNDNRKPRDIGRNSAFASSTGYPTPSMNTSQSSSASSTQSSTVAKSIPVSIGPSPHMLHHKWTLYFDRRAAVKPKSTGPTPGTSASFDTTEYESNLIVVGTIVSVESFWQYWRAIVPPSQLEANSNYHLFRCNAADGSSIKPTWEDPANSKGGKWTVKWNARDKDRFDTYALNTCLALIGQQIGAGDSAADQLINSDEINGCVISRRRTGDRISVWNKSSDDAIVKQIGQCVKQLCVGDSQSQVTVSYDIFEALTH